ncbi:uncharacterized protein Dyak_GE29153 [Drosophila yakuba]|uniref:Uncharacterized protein n=1 Tax=Drosophila yakuba TaxID=7245 RepID=A0A0R1E881_DROYA|nr:uncharacterized protein Dyak_GE29153 [Drosophila yakuba]
MDHSSLRENRNCRKRDTWPPYANTMPENRRYGLVITNQSSDTDGVDTVALIVNAN